MKEKKDDEYYKHYNRNRPNADKRNKENIERTKLKYRTNSEYKEKILETKRKWLNKNIDKRKAQNAANNALRDGIIQRKYSCEHCQQQGVKLQKHHHSYLQENWLDVIWLCTGCHGKEHKRLNDLGRDPDKRMKNEYNYD